MGSNNSKKDENKELKKIGQDANKSEPSTFLSFTPIKVTNELIVAESKSNSDGEYKKIKFLGEGSYASVYQVQNKYTGSICAMKVIKKKF